MFQVAVQCDHPDHDIRDDQPWLFDDEAEALAGVLQNGWRQWPDGRLLCISHSLLEDCVQAGGHTYGPWYSGSGICPEWVRSWRTCTHCNAVERGQPTAEPAR